MTHIGVKRLGARNGQNHATHGVDSHVRVIDQQMNGIHGIQRQQHIRVLNDVENPHRRQHRKPGTHDRAKECTHFSRAVLLEEEQTRQNHDRERDHHAL